ncbi:unnamed protein product [Rotaria sordida]|uniref:Uncharacterized protein n=3 Tax=Rotaria sordida TaxID=392033 RepID=A0A815C5N6_9BILA|nr:unnamed protein product [Rotaria sordida]
MPLIYNPSFNEASYLKKIKKKQTSLDHSSYRVTVRRITAPHIAAAAAEAYRMNKNKVSNTIYYGQFNQTVMNNHEQYRMRKKYEKDSLNSNNEKLPSVPFKKILTINNGIQVSSTSLITTTTIDDQQNFISDNIAEKNYSEHDIKQPQTFNELLSSIIQTDQSTNDRLALFKPHAASINVKAITSTLPFHPITISPPRMKDHSLQL